MAAAKRPAKRGRRGSHGSARQLLASRSGAPKIATKAIVEWGTRPDFSCLDVLELSFRPAADVSSPTASISPAASSPDAFLSSTTWRMRSTESASASLSAGSSVGDERVAADQDPQRLSEARGQASECRGVSSRKVRECARANCRCLVPAEAGRIVVWNTSPNGRGDGNGRRGAAYWEHHPLRGGGWVESSLWRCC